MKNKVKDYNEEIQKVLSEALNKHQDWHETIDLGDEDHVDMQCMQCLERKLEKRYTQHNQPF